MFSGLPVRDDVVGVCSHTDGMSPSSCLCSSPFAGPSSIPRSLPLSSFACFSAWQGTHRRWKHTRGSIGWELTKVSKKEARQRRERAKQLAIELEDGGRSYSQDGSVNGSPRRGSRVLQDRDADEIEDEEEEEEEKEEKKEARAREKAREKAREMDASKPLGKSKAQAPGTELGPALVCEFNTQVAPPQHDRPLHSTPCNQKNFEGNHHLQLGM
eukprot:3781423-Rhodomonas_salina.1